MNHKIGIIIGSTRPGRVGKGITDWYLRQIKDTKNAYFEVIDLAEINLPMLDEPVPASMGNYQKEHTKKWSELIKGFDAYIWVTPEYNHAAPASLTNAISYLYNEWIRKPVGLVSYGSMGGIRSQEHLRQIAGELQMVDIRPFVSVREPWAAFDEKGDVRQELIFGDPKAQKEDLLWWSDALKTKRT